MSNHLKSLVYRRVLGGSNRKSVLARLADIAHDDGTSIYPSVNTVALQTEVSRRTVQRVLSDFVKEGILVIVRHKRGGAGNVREYRIDVNVVAALPPSIDEVLAVYESPGSTGANQDEIPPAYGGKKGDKLAPFSGSRKPERVTPSPKRVTPDAQKGDTVSPKPPLTTLTTSVVGREHPATTQLDVELIETELRKAAGEGLNSAALGLVTLAAPLGWLENGADFYRDVIPAITARSRSLKPHSVRSWHFFSGVVADWMEQRAAGADLPVATPKVDPVTFSDNDWQRRVSYFNQTGGWAEDWGPAPNQPGCLAPVHIQQIAENP